MKRNKQAATTDDKKLLEIAYCALRGDYPKTDSFSNEVELHRFAKFYNALKTICKIPPIKRKEDEIKELLQELKISTEVVTEMLKFLTSSRAVEVDSYLLQTKSRLPHITNVEWRVNVVISSSFISRVMVPYVEICLTLSTGKKVQFEINLQTFHSIRFAVAKLLKEMQHLELRPALQ